MGAEENHFTKEEILNYLNIDFDFDKMVEIDIHLRGCKTCRSLSKKLEDESNRKQRDIQFDQETELRRNLIIKESGSKSGHPIRFILIALVIVSLSSLAYYNSDLLIQRKVTNEQTSLAEPNTKIQLDDNNVQSDSVEVDLANNSVVGQDSVVAYSEQSVSLLASSENQELPQVNNDDVMPLANETSISQTESNKPIEPQVFIDSSTLVKNTEKIIDEVEETMPEIEIPASKGSLFASPNKSNQSVPSTGYDDFNIYIESNFIYPEAAKLSKVEGPVIVEFMVSEGGNVTDTKIIKGLGHGCDEVVIDLLRNSVAWKSYIGEDFVENKSASVLFIFKL